MGAPIIVELHGPHIWVVPHSQPSSHPHSDAARALAVLSTAPLAAHWTQVQPSRSLDSSCSSNLALLEGGAPDAYSLAPGGLPVCALFSVPVGSDGGDPVLELTPTIGEVDVYMSVSTTSGGATQPTPASHQFSWTGRQAPLGITLRQNGLAQQCTANQQCFFFVTMYAPASMQGVTVAGRMRLLPPPGAATATPIPLVLDQPLTDTVRGDTAGGSILYRYYAITTAPASTWRISMSPISGDPDMFVGELASIPRPTYANNNYSALAMGLGHEVIDVPSCRGLAPCQWVIGVADVSSNQGASFELTATYNNTDYVQLEVGGQWIYTSVDENAYTYFDLTVVGSVRGAEIEILSVSGDPDLLANVNGQRPTLPNAQYASREPDAWDAISISQDDPAMQQSCASVTKPCRILVAVYGFGSASTFLIRAVATSGNPLPRQLVEGVPGYGAATESTYAYFQFTPANVGQVDWEFAVSAISGDADVFALAGAPDESVHPGRFHYTWASATPGSEIVIVQRTDNRLQPGQSVYLGVHCYATVNCTFIIEAKESDVEVAFPMSIGSTYHSLLYRDTTDYWLVESSGTQAFNQLVFGASPVSEQVDIALTFSPGTTRNASNLRFPHWGCQSTDELPPPSTMPLDDTSVAELGVPGQYCHWNYWYRLGSRDADGDSSISISASTGLLNRAYTFVGGVVGLPAEAQSQYSEYFAFVDGVQMGSNATVQPVLPGVRYPLLVLPGDTYFFEATLHMNLDVSVHVDSEVGVGGLSFIASDTDPRPTKDHASGQGNYFLSQNYLGPKDTTIFIPFADLTPACRDAAAAEGCTLYFSVALASSSSKTNGLPLAVSLGVSGTPDTASHLQLNMPSTVDVPVHELTYFRVKLPSNLSTSVDISMSLNEQAAAVYVVYNTSMFYPSVRTHVRTTTAYAPRTAFLSISQSDLADCPDCELHLTILPRNTSGVVSERAVIQATITVSGSSQFTDIAVNAAALDWETPAMGASYFRLYEASTYSRRKAADVVVEVLPAAGSVSLAMLVDSGSGPQVMPSPHNYQWYVGPGDPQKIITIPATDPAACSSQDQNQPCTYMLAVTSASVDDAAYSVSAWRLTSPPSVRTLTEGRASLQYVSSYSSSRCVYSQFVPGAAAAPSSPRSISLLFDQYYGSAALDVFVVNTYDSSMGPSALPGPHNKDPCQLRQSDPDVITIVPTPGGAGPNHCWDSAATAYTLASCVLADDSGSTSFRLYAQRGNLGDILIPQGQSSPQLQLPAGQVQYFSFFVPRQAISASAGGSVRLTLQLTGGAATAFVSSSDSISTRLGLTSDQFMWNMTFGTGPVDVLVVDNSSPCSSQSHGTTAKCLYVGGLWQLAVRAESNVELSVLYDISYGSSSNAPQPQDMVAGGRAAVVPSHLAQICSSRAFDGACTAPGQGIAQAAWLSIPVSAGALDSNRIQTDISLDLLQLCGDETVDPKSRLCPDDFAALDASTVAVGQLCTGGCTDSNKLWPIPSQFGGTPLAEVEFRGRNNILRVPAGSECSGPASRDGWQGCVLYVGVYTHAAATPATQATPAKHVLNGASSADGRRLSSVWAPAHFTGGWDIPAKNRVMWQVNVAVQGLPFKLSEENTRNVFSVVTPALFMPISSGTSEAGMAAVWGAEYPGSSQGLQAAVSFRRCTTDAFKGYACLDSTATPSTCADQGNPGPGNSDLSWDQGASAFVEVGTSGLALTAAARVLNTTGPSNSHIPAVQAVLRPLLTGLPTPVQMGSLLQVAADAAVLQVAVWAGTNVTFSPPQPFQSARVQQLPAASIAFSNAALPAVPAQNLSFILHAMTAAAVPEWALFQHSCGIQPAAAAVLENGGQYWATALSSWDEAVDYSGDEPLLFVLEAVCSSYVCMVPGSAPSQSIVLGSTATAPVTPSAIPPKHHPNGPLIGGIIGSLLLVLAAVAAALAYRAGKLPLPCIASSAHAGEQAHTGQEGYAELQDGGGSLNSAA